MSDKYHCKALDVETKQVLTYEVEPCDVCGKWHVVASSVRFCEWCGAKIGNEQLSMLEDEEE